jgi:hypothetical protein
MLQKSLPGAILKRGWADPVHDSSLLLIDLHPLDQRSHDLTPRQPVRAVQSLGYPTRKFLQLTDHQPQFRVPVFLFGPLFVLLLQLRQPLPRRPHPRLELRLVQEAVPIRIDQSRNCLSHMTDKLGDLAGLTTVASPRPFQTPPVLLSNTSGLRQQRGDIFPHGRVQLVGPDSLGSAQLLSAVPPRL